MTSDQFAILMVAIPLMGLCVLVVVSLVIHILGVLGVSGGMPWTASKNKAEDT